jgi:hypothetical protein
MLGLEASSMPARIVVIHRRGSYSKSAVLRTAGATIRAAARGEP